MEIKIPKEVREYHETMGVYFGRRTVCRLRIFYLPRHDAGATAVGMVQIRTAVPQTAGVPLG